MFRRYWIQLLVDYNTDHGRFSQNYVRFHEADDLSGLTYLTHTQILPSYAAQLRHMATCHVRWAWLWHTVFRIYPFSSGFTSPFPGPTRPHVCYPVVYYARARSTMHRHRPPCSCNTALRSKKYSYSVIKHGCHFNKWAYSSPVFSSWTSILLLDFLLTAVLKRTSVLKKKGIRLTNQRWLQHPIL